jgi:hypothetical protein
MQLKLYYKNKYLKKNYHFHFINNYKIIFSFFILILIKFNIKFYH